MLHMSEMSLLKSYTLASFFQSCEQHKIP